MAASFEAQNGQTKVTHELIGTTDKIVKGYTAAAHYLWDRGRGDHGTEEEPIVFDDLTNQDKLDIVHTHLIKVIKDMAKTYLVSTAKDEGGEEGQAEYETEVEIEDVV